MIYLPLLAVVAACWPSFTALHVAWTDWNASPVAHGYLIAAIFAWLLWRDAGLGMPARSRVPPIYMLALIACSLLWLFAVQAGFQALEFLVLPLLAWAALAASWGTSTARRAAFPVAMLYFAMPLWGLVNWPFQWATVYAVRFALRLFDIPAYFDANHVHIPAGTFEIAGGCSGLHFVVVGAALATLLGELRGDDWRGRFKLLALAIGLSVLTNWVRVFTIILAGHFTHMQHYLVTRSHYGYGWLLFAVALAAFFVLERRIPVRSPQAPPRQESQRAAAPAPGLSAISAPLVMVVLGITALWHEAALRPADARLPPVAPPSGWTTGPTGWKPVFSGIDLEQASALISPAGSRVDVYQGLYRTQRQGKELSGYDNSLVGDDQTTSQYTQVLGSVPRSILLVRDPAQQQAVLATTYLVGESSFSDPTRAQWWYAWQALTRFRSPASRVVVLRARCMPDCEAALRLIQETGI